MTKKHFMKSVADGAGVTIPQAEAVLNAASQVAAESLVRDGQVKVPGLATLVVKQYGPRPGRNPRTGEDRPVPAAKRVRIKPSTALQNKFAAELQRAE